jgi:hypothetical protein
MPLIPDKTRTENGVSIYEKIIPWGAVWSKDYGSYKKGDKYKADRLLSGGSGKVQGVTIHNTDGSANAETYTRATYPNQNMKDARVHYYVDDVEAWQNLQENEVGWHAGDGRGNGNETTVSIEIIQQGAAIKDNAKAEDNGARLAAAILSRNGLTVDQLYTHNHWMGLPDSIVKGAAKNCPVYILPHWPEFKAKVKGYLPASAPAPLPAPSLPATPPDQYIWEYLRGRGLNSYAVAGIMGNLYAESGLKSTNLQNSFEKSLNMTDEQYTAAVDNNTYKNFANDSAGYGLAQWTFNSRKQALFDYTRGAGASIGDITKQMEFLYKELQGYTALMARLNASKTVLEASTAFLFDFEKPDDQSAAVQKKRAEYGQAYFNKYAGSTPAPAPTPPASPDLDNTPRDWEKKAVDLAISRGIIAGDDTGNLRLHSPASRADVLVFFERCGIL